MPTSADRLRVLTCIHSFEPGGVERVALRLCRALRQLGLDAPVAVGRDTGAMRDLGHGLDLHVASRTRLTAPFETLWLIAVLPGIVRRLRPDVLFFPGNTYAVVAAAMKCLLGSDCPPVVLKVSNTLQRSDMNGGLRTLYGLWCRIQGRFLDRVIAMAEPLRAEIEATMCVPHARIAIVDDPALTREDFVRLGELGDAAQRSVGSGRRILASGRLVKQKNFALLIDAFADAAGPDDLLTIIGSGPCFDRLKRRIAALGIEHQILLKGFQADPLAVFASADVFALTSDYEGLPAVLVEALAARCPIIATDCSPMIAAMVQASGGRTVRIGDRAGLAKALAQFADARAPITARDYAERFTLDVAARRYAEVFAEAVSQSRRTLPKVHPASI